MSPYKDKEARKRAARESMAKKRGENVNPSEDVNPKKLTPDVNPKEKPLDPWDWRDRRNYSEVYLKCLDEQGGHLTEASKVALKIRREGKTFPFLYCGGEEKPVDEVKKAKAKGVLASFNPDSCKPLEVEP